MANVINVGVNELNAMIDLLHDKGNISDGSHTFEELYYHRAVLFSVICNQNKEIAGKSWKHDDGSMFEDYFIVWIETPEGNYSYHYHKDYWEMFTVKEYANAPKWDGHEPKDVSRLLSLSKGATKVRELQTIQQKEKLNHIFAVDEKGVGGASHEYAVHVTPTKEVTLSFQNGARKEKDSVHGLVYQDLLEVVRDRITGFQDGDFANEYNAKALYHLNKALQAMNERVEDRIKRNVLGTYNK